MSTLATNAITDASGGNTATINSYTPTESNMAGRNLIINGAMQVAQRGTSHTYSNSQSGYHTLDRFFSAAFVSGGTLAVSQQSVSLSDNIEAEFFLRATTTGSIAAGSATVYSETRLENLKFFHNKTLTLSFYAKADAALTFQVRTYKNYGSGGSAEEYSGFSDISVTNSWTKYTLTFSAEDLSSKTFGTSSYFGLMFYWSTGQGSNQLNDNSIDITLVQLEAGSVATPFEHRLYGQELALCQRYALMMRTDASMDRFVVGSTVNSTTVQIIVQHPASFRAAASSLLTTGTASDYAVYSTGVTTCSQVPSLGASNTYNSRINFITSGGLTGGQASQAISTTGAFLLLSAEL